MKRKNDLCVPPFDIKFSLDFVPDKNLWIVLEEDEVFLTTKQFSADDPLSMSWILKKLNLLYCSRYNKRMDN